MFLLDLIVVVILFMPSISIFISFISIIITLLFAIPITLFFLLFLLQADSELGISQIDQISAIVSSEDPDAVTDAMPGLDINT